MAAEMISGAISMEVIWRSSGSNLQLLDLQSDELPTAL